ncbi:thioredoxin domain-containing protein [Desulfobotulus sp. H1]|uniref:Thioredoxin domain-containing protein n=1 Tax=Desulfobotulus pelophilus TaxID=2823377 RepID=A0ABT3ND28_9BACT|nr:thioredoxin domain-containing protein [Desulfobotulus pelophilus]MCW7755359.1 thioredoxin domain-containing protein [Desulfobotulus pelophilus]
MMTFRVATFFKDESYMNKTGFFVGLLFFLMIPVTVFGAESVSLDEEALKKTVARRTVISWGEQDERFRSFGPDQVRIVQKIPVNMNGVYLFAVRVALVMPPPQSGEEQLFLVVDPTGQMQFTDIQDLSSGRSLLEEPLAYLRHIDDFPKDLGTVLLEGGGPHEMLVVSDPFCPYCRKGWDFVKEKRNTLKELRLVHFPLNPVSELVCMVLADVEKRNFKPLEVTDFAYGDLRFVQDPKAILDQFMAVFPELKSSWGDNAEAARNYLESAYGEKVRSERRELQRMGIQATPVFFINGHMVEGFQLDKMRERLK